MGLLGHRRREGCKKNPEIRRNNEGQPRNHVAVIRIFSVSRRLPGTYSVKVASYRPTLSYGITAKERNERPNHTWSTIVTSSFFSRDSMQSSGRSLGEQECWIERFFGPMRSATASSHEVMSP